MKFHIRTLGCKMNWLDSARTTALLLAAGHQQVDDESAADVVLVNSCTVTGEAEKKSQRSAARAARSGGQVAVLGCSPRVSPIAWRKRMPEALIFNAESDLLAHFGIEPDDHLLPADGRTRLPVAIQTGCDNRCTFCITRLARGPHRDIPAAEVVAQVRRAVDAGVKEVILTGINLAAWGCSDSNRADESRLAQLLEQLLEHTAIPRIRISSVGPQYLDAAFWSLYADRRLCDHLHLSIQSGSPAVLADMDRGHGTDEVYRIAERARSIRPDTALTCDLITGFPGESENHFGETEQFARDIGFAKLHVFPYSEREGTPAAEMPGQVPMAERRRRAGLLRDTGRELRTDFIDRQLGRAHDVLAERGSSGLTTNYIRVRVDADPGTIVPQCLHRDILAEA